MTHLIVCKRPPLASFSKIQSFRLTTVHRFPSLCRSGTHLDAATGSDAREAVALPEPRELPQEGTAGAGARRVRIRRPVRLVDSREKAAAMEAARDIALASGKSSGGRGEPRGAGSTEPVEESAAWGATTSTALTGRAAATGRIEAAEAG